MKKNKKLIVMLSAILIVLILLVIMLFMRQNSGGEGDSANEETMVEDAPVQETPAVEEETLYKIETEYTDLHYPEKWKSQIEIEEETDEVHTVRFYAVVEGKEKQHIFDIVFGGEDGFNIGTVNKDGEDVSVNIISYDLEFDENWTDEEQQNVIMMQEDVNYIIDMLGED